MSLPKTYTALQIAGPGEPLKAVQKELKAPGKGEVLLKIQASSICFSDHNATVKGVFPVPWPMSPGHEAIGKIVAHGEGVDAKLWPIGKQCGFGWNGGYCGQCAACRKGEFYACVEGRVHGVTIDGGHQEYVSTRVNALVAVPDGMKMSAAEMAPLLCGGITVFDALKAVQDVAKPGELVAVVGMGGLGHLAVQYAVGMGYEVAAISSTASKADLAKKSGAKHYFTSDKAADELQKLGGAKAIVSTAPAAKAVNSALGGLARGGKMVVVGIPTDGAPFSVPSLPMIVNRQTLCGLTCGHAANNEETLRFSNVIDLKPHVTTHSPDKAPDAFAQTLAGKAEGRNVIVFE